MPRLAVCCCRQESRRRAERDKRDRVEKRATRNCRKRPRSNKDGETSNTEIADPWHAKKEAVVCDPARYMPNGRTNLPPSPPPPPSPPSRERTVQRKSFIIATSTHYPLPAMSSTGWTRWRMPPCRPCNPREPAHEDGRIRPLISRFWERKVVSIGTLASGNFVQLTPKQPPRPAWIPKSARPSSPGLPGMCPRCPSRTAGGSCYTWSPPLQWQVLRRVPGDIATARG